MSDIIGFLIIGFAIISFMVLLFKFRLSVKEKILLEKTIANAERDFQNSDDWNDYLTQIISDTRAEALDDFAEALAPYGVYDYWGNVIDVVEITERLKKKKGGINK